MSELKKEAEKYKNEDHYRDYFSYEGFIAGATSKYVKEITENIAIDFAKWLTTEECLDLIHDMDIVGEDTSIESLFQEFLKTKQYE